PLEERVDVLGDGGIAQASGHKRNARNRRAGIARRSVDRLADYVRLGLAAGARDLLDPLLQFIRQVDRRLSHTIRIPYVYHTSASADNNQRRVIFRRTADATPGLHLG